MDQPVILVKGSFSGIPVASKLTVVTSPEALRAEP
jgi:hypothetical protein